MANFPSNQSIVLLITNIVGGMTDIIEAQWRADKVITL